MRKHYTSIIKDTKYRTREDVNIENCKWSTLPLPVRDTLRKAYSEVRSKYGVKEYSIIRQYQIGIDKFAYRLDILTYKGQLLALTTVY